MLSYLKGTLVQIQKTNNRTQIILEVQSVAYEIFITHRHSQELPTTGEILKIFTHLQVREDQWTLYGFGSSAERDLFRQLIGVSGIGAQMGLALLDTLALETLVQAIVSGNSRALTRAPGVGNKTADRVVLELKTKLEQWRDKTGLSTAPSALPQAAIQEEVELTLLALGYSDTEIIQALQAVGESTALSKSDQAEDWIRESIAWLSQ
ncbi:MAG: Holliday junction branch migration protein RuvA [Prochlorothrix sp.]|nr:Holliday junction branch migration protein RuvA [Prochlorothrix sp.]